jgi:Ni,Fe-hydrogenase I cytochrome b subunit
MNKKLLFIILILLCVSIHAQQVYVPYTVHDDDVYLFIANDTDVNRTFTSILNKDSRAIANGDESELQVDIVMMARQALPRTFHNNIYKVTVRYMFGLIVYQIYFGMTDEGYEKHILIKYY